MPEPPEAAEGKCGRREKRGKGAGRGRGKEGEKGRREERMGEGMNERGQREPMGPRPNPGSGQYVKEVGRSLAESGESGL